MGYRHVAKWANQFSFIILFNNPSLLSQNAEAVHHVVATFVLVLQEAYPLSTEVIHFSRKFL